MIRGTMNYSEPSAPRARAYRHADLDEVFDWIVAYKREHDGNSPTLREIMEGLRMSGTSVVYDALRGLQGKGLIQIDEKRSRSISVVGGRWSLEEKQDAA